jgi:hypothetical protein
MDVSVQNYNEISCWTGHYDISEIDLLQNLMEYIQWDIYRLAEAFARAIGIFEV